MDASRTESIYFQCCRDINGRLVPVDRGRRNRRLVPLFGPSWIETSENSPDPFDSDEYLELVHEICYNLTPRQREVFLTLTDAPSISEAARRCKVSPPAIHDLLRRMANRNEYVAIWRARHKQHPHV